MIALGVVTAWAVFAYAYLGVEDGSSGLSPLGWVQGVIFLPGGLLMQALKGSHRNSDLPVMTAVGWLAYSFLAVAIVWMVQAMRQGVVRNGVNLHGERNE